MGSVWLVRHAPVAVRGICYGQSDVAVALSAAAAVDVLISAWERAGAPGCEEIWSSPWLRTREVAELLVGRWGVPWYVDPRLSELAFGAWERRLYADIEREDGARFARWMRAYETIAPPGGETVTELRARVGGWLAERERGLSTVLAVTHAGVIRTARAIARSVGYAKALGEPVDHLLPERV